MIGRELAYVGRSAQLPVAPRSPQTLGDLHGAPFGLSRSMGARRAVCTSQVTSMPRPGTASGEHRGLQRGGTYEIQAPTATIRTGLAPSSGKAVHLEAGPSKWWSGALLYSAVSAQLDAGRPLAQALPRLSDQPSDVPKTPYISLIWQLVEQQQLSAARRLLALLPDELGLRRIRRLLNPPETSVSPRQDTDRTADYEWLSRHAHEHAGQWVAVLGGSLVSAQPSLKALRQQLGELSLASPPLVHRVD